MKLVKHVMVSEMYPRFRFKIRQISDGWVEVCAPSKEMAINNIKVGGFVSHGQLLCSYTKNVEIGEEIAADDV